MGGTDPLAGSAATRRGSLPFVPFLVALSLSGCRAEPPPEIVLGLIAPLDRSEGTVEGARLAVATINERGGLALGGRPTRLRLAVEDSESSSEVALRKAIKLINTDGAAALLGLPISENAIPVARLAENGGVPMITTRSTHPETTAGRSYVFRMTFLDSVQGRAMADFAFHRLGARTAAALMNSGNTYSTYLGGVFCKTFRGHGGAVLAAETFTEDGDAVPQLERIREADPDVLFLPYFLGLAEAHMEAARASAIEATFLGADTWDAVDYRHLPAAWGSYFSDVWAPDHPGNAPRAFIERYRRAVGRSPTNSAALSYDAVAILAEAIRSRQSAARDAIQQGLAAIDRFEGVSGSIAFDAEGDATRSVFVRRIEEGGEVRLFQVIDPPVRAVSPSASPDPQDTPRAATRAARSGLRP